MRISDWSSDVCSSDLSASTRIAVWKWTWDYAKDHPGGGGFEAYLGNSLSYYSQQLEGPAASQSVERTLVVDKGRAYHSAYFELLGEQGYFGFVVWIGRASCRERVCQYV